MSLRNLLLVGLAAMVLFSTGRLLKASLVSLLSYHEVIKASEDYTIRFVPANNNYNNNNKSKNHHHLPQQCKIDYQGIARRQRLQDPQAAALWLKKMVETPPIPAFNHDNDLFVLEHIMKTGGTSFSDKLLEMFGRQGVVPGSLRSGWFDKAQFENALPKESSNSNSTQWWESKRVAYSHSEFQQPTHKRTEGSFEAWFLNHIPVDSKTGKPAKRVWMGTLYRHPLEWVASHHFEWMCKLGPRMEHLWKYLHPHEKRMSRGGPKGDESCWGMNNLTALANHWLHHMLPEKCARNDKKDTRECQKYAKTKQDPVPRCQSAINLAQSNIFQTQLQNHPQYLIEHPKANESLAALEQLTLQRYGGFAPHNTVRVAWLGLTERYDESLVLFYDWLGWPFEDVGKSPKQRYKTCRPTSFWTAEEQKMLSHLMLRSFVVHNVANAILDVRMAAWCCRNRHTEEANNKLSETERAVVQRFCQEGNNQTTPSKRQFNIS